MQLWGGGWNKHLARDVVREWGPSVILPFRGVLEHTFPKAEQPKQVHEFSDRLETRTLQDNSTSHRILESRWRNFLYSAAEQNNGLCINVVCMNWCFFFLHILSCHRGIFMQVSNCVSWKIFSFFCLLSLSSLYNSLFHSVYSNI